MDKTVNLKITGGFGVGLLWELLIREGLKCQELCIRRLVKYLWEHIGDKCVEEQSERQ